MGKDTNIEWCHHSFNTHWGCAAVSSGCDNCYAESMAKRFGVMWGVDVERKAMSDSYWKQPLKWNKRSAENGIRERVFCASMADVFDKNAPEGARERLWQLIKDTPSLDWLLLTKRIGNAKTMLPSDWGKGYPNVWLGISVANQEEADRDIPKLLNTYANIRFLSIEPMLGPIDLTHLNKDKEEFEMSCLTAYTWEEEIENWRGTSDTWESDLADWYSVSDDHLSSGPMHNVVDWVIVGGESGNNARPMHPDWARSIRDQCQAAGVPFLFKQWGEWAIHKKPQGYYKPIGEFAEWWTINPNRWHFTDSPNGLNLEMKKIGKKEAGRLLDGVEYNEYPMWSLYAQK